jgi:2-amino-4-hydroxy-6-hydroxymethyldihydropteridine diphosphokinase
MILIALGSNLPSPFGDSRETVEAAFGMLSQAPLELIARSRLWRTRPMPDDGQPWFVNAVASVATSLEPSSLLDHLHAIEHRFGRERREMNAPRTLDLDLLDYDQQIADHPMLPHPRLRERAFVLLPLREIAPGWRHPVDHRLVDELINGLPVGQTAEAME